MTAPGMHAGAPAPDMTLRPEARPLPYHRLDRQQQAAFELVVALLHAAASAVQGSNPPSSTEQTGRPPARTPFLDTGRAGRNILVSGGRGTGKTTLLLSLASSLAAGPATPGWLTDVDGLPSDDTPEGPSLRERILFLRRRLVWLETLDMEPLSEQTNLLGAVLARVEDAVGARFPAWGGSTGSPAMSYPGPDYHDVQQQLTRLQTSVALTFEGNLSARGASLDPDTFAIESRRTERERLSLDRRFATVLASLSASLERSGELRDPVFVLPVDDLDLNIRMCLPLLKLLRKAQSPHLLVLMAADVALLATVTRLLYRGDLADIGRRAGSSRDLPTSIPLSEPDQRQADDLAANALRKHLPPTQRVHLGLVDPVSALDYPPGAQGDEKLHDLIAGVKLRPDEAQLGLDPNNFWVEYPTGGVPSPVSRPVAPVVPPPGASAETIDGYSWAEALRLPMRHVVDLYQACRRDQDPRHRSPDEEGEGGGPLRRWAGGRLEEWREEASRSGATWAVPGGHPEARWAPRPSATRLPLGESGIVVETSSFPDVILSPGSGDLTSAESKAYVGCQELAGSDPPLLPPHFWMPMRTSVLPGNEPNQITRINWPWVNHSTFWAYEEAMSLLRRVAPAWQQSGQPDPLFGSWIAVMTYALFGRRAEASVEPTTAPAGAPPDQPITAPATEWTSLSTHLRGLPDMPPAKDWLIAVGLLCTPELGMSAAPPFTDLLTADLPARIESARAARSALLPGPARELVGTWSPVTPSADDKATGRSKSSPATRTPEQRGTRTTPTNKQGR